MYFAFGDPTVLRDKNLFKKFSVILSIHCKQPHSPTSSPNREGGKVPLCKERDLGWGCFNKVWQMKKFSSLSSRFLNYEIFWCLVAVPIIRLFPCILDIFFYNKSSIFLVYSKRKIWLLLLLSHEFWCLWYWLFFMNYDISQQQGNQE